jgi:hypothetical protein
MKHHGTELKTYNIYMVFFPSLLKMSSGFDLPGITNPITHVGRVVYNAASDRQEIHKRKLYARRGSGGSRQAVYEKEKTLDDENFTIQPYELCVRNKNGNHVSRPNDTDIHVFSCANGMHVSGAGPDKKKRKRADLEFAGVASNRANYDPSNSTNEEMLAVQVGGLQTMYNTGEEAIYAGDIVLWDMPEGPPKKRIPGVPRDKKLFLTVSYKTALEEAKNVVNAAKANDLPEFLRAHNDLARRVIGKALSTAQPGKPFDILLGHYCV